MIEAMIKIEFLSGELSYIDAIELLIAMGYSSFDAEDIVSEWEEDK